MRLDRLQSLFFGRLMGSVADDDARLAKALLSDERASGLDRMGIYAGMYLQRLVATLEDDHPAVRGAVGDGFDDLARDYVRARPSRHPSLRELGVGFGDFLAERGLAWQADLARLERARIEMFDGPPDAVPLGRADVAALGDELASLTVALVPAHVRLALGHRITPRLARYLDGDTTPAPPEPEVVIVWRQGIDVYHATVDADEDAALGWLASGVPLGVMFERVAERHPDADAATLAFTMLGRWLDDGLLTARTTGIITPDGRW